MESQRESQRASMCEKQAERGKEVLKRRDRNPRKWKKCSKEQCEHTEHEQLYLK